MACGVAAAALLVTGFWGRGSMPGDTAVPKTETGVVRQVSGSAGAFSFQPGGSGDTAGYALARPALTCWSGWSAHAGPCPCTRS